MLTAFNNGAAILLLAHHRFQQISRHDDSDALTDLLAPLFGSHCTVRGYGNALPTRNKVVCNVFRR